MVKLKLNTIDMFCKTLISCIKELLLFIFYYQFNSNIKKVLLVFTIFLVLACTKEELPIIKFGSPYPADKSENYSLVPYLGFNGFTGSTTILFDYYCDTINPPLHLVFKGIYARFGQRIPHNQMLVAGKKYYWKCVAKDGGRNVSSDIFSFTTISLDKIYNQRWDFNVFVKEKDYNSELIFNLLSPSYYKVDLADSISFGEVMSFNIKTRSDSAYEVFHFGDLYNKIFPKRDAFYFSTDSVRISFRDYDFINFGTKEYGNDTSLILTLKRHQDNLIVIYDNQ